MSCSDPLVVGFIGAVVGAASTALFGWIQSVRLTKMKFASALFRLEHTLKHRKSENIYDTFTDVMVFEIWDLGMSYVTLYPIWCCRQERIKIGYLLGLMETIEGHEVKHSLTDRSLPSVHNALRYINELFIMLGYKKR
jgi:hypothetical protein